MAIGQQRKEREQAAIDAVLAEHKGAHRDSLIPILQHMQDRVGYLSVAAVASRRFTTNSVSCRRGNITCRCAAGRRVT